MSTTDRLLIAVLQAYQSVYDQEQTKRALSSTASLLMTLSNPLNLTVLTSQLLISPSVWEQIDGLQTCAQIFGIFNTASVNIRQHNIDGQHDVWSPGFGGRLTCDSWAKAVIRGADDKSPKWRHILVIGGVLIGMGTQGRRGLSSGLRRTLEDALVTVTNSTLLNPTTDTELAFEVVVLILSYTFDLLSEGPKRRLKYDVLTPIMVRTMVGREGYDGGNFLGTIDRDVTRLPGNKYEWSPKSMGFNQLQILISKPLVASMGLLSRVTDYGVGHMADSRRVMNLLEDLVTFSSMLENQWRQNKFSEIDLSNEESLLMPETRSVTFPMLWHILKSAMFAIVNILRAIVGRALIDPALGADGLASSATLHVLRNIYFIVSRLGPNSFSAFTFTYLTAIDLLSHFPTGLKIFLKQIQPAHLGQIPVLPLDRILDLYFLNTCEHFTFLLSAEENEFLVMAASPYLSPSDDYSLAEIFEAAHSATLTALLASQSASLTTKFIPFYVQALFGSFPRNLSPRQFRFAFKILLQIAMPPAPLSAMEPPLADTLLEMLYYRATQASTLPLPPQFTMRGGNGAELNDSQLLLSEQAVIILALLDGLPFLTCSALEEWLPLAAELLNMIGDNSMREVCKARYWEVLEDGEMDADHAAICVAWWTTRGGRDLVLFGRPKQDDLMSGALTPRDGSSL